MLPLRRLWTFFLPISFLALCARADDDQNTAFLFNEFNGENLILMGDASIMFSNVLSLTNSSYAMFGHALYGSPVTMRSHGSANTVSSFSTTFVFSIVSSSPHVVGHGIAFMLTPYRSYMGELPAGYLGLLNFTSNGEPYNHLFAVEFDTVLNLEFQDIDDNHVGVDINSLHSVESRTAGYWTAQHRFSRLNLRSGRNIQAWIDYDHPQNHLNVTMALAGLDKPIRPLISVKNIDLSDILLDQMYVGFSASTGFSFIESHYILAWSFNTNGVAPALNLSHLPDFTDQNTSSQSQASVASITVASIILIWMFSTAVICWLKRLRDRGLAEERNLDYYPRRFTCKDIRIAPTDCREDQLLGSGGFGRVYKGIIRRNGTTVAVKYINKQVSEGTKEFIAEVSSMGRLQHRNLVKLRGWGMVKKQLFIVYDYMPNGSLDKRIFENPRTVLRWPQRYTVLRGVAAGLLYLHEESEKRVVHRDIKSSNVLLDSELHAKLGDFGFARSYDYTDNPERSGIVGTIGYIAPEIMNTGKPTPAADIFSFGVLMLEVACGRRALDQSKNIQEVVLVDWVKELYLNGKMMDVVDPNLGDEYDYEEMRRVILLGLICSNPDPEQRLTTKHVFQILEGEAPVPSHKVPGNSSLGLVKSYGFTKYDIDVFSTTSSQPVQ